MNSPGTNKEKSAQPTEENGEYREQSIPSIQTNKANWEAWTAIGTIGMLIIFTIISVVQSFQTREALSLARKNYTDENRPYVFPSNPTMKFQYGEPVAIIPFINYGKTPAYNFIDAIKFQHWSTIEDPRPFIYPPIIKKEFWHPMPQTLSELERILHTGIQVEIVDFIWSGKHSI
jgi:hypothetical protein